VVKYHNGTQVKLDLQEQDLKPSEEGRLDLNLSKIFSNSLLESLEVQLVEDSIPWSVTIFSVKSERSSWLVVFDGRL